MVSIWIKFITDYQVSVWIEFPIIFHFPSLDWEFKNIWWKKEVANYFPIAFKKASLLNPCNQQKLNSAREHFYHRENIQRTPNQHKMSYFNIRTIYCTSIMKILPKYCYHFLYEPLENAV